MCFRPMGLVLIVGVTLVLYMMTSITGTSSETYAAKKYEKNQATMQTSSCGNVQIYGGSGIAEPPTKLSGGTFCQNINAQIQGDDNTAALAGVQQQDR